MDFLKEIFGEDTLTFDAFVSKVTEKGIKLADLSTGNYVDKKKYEDAVSTKDTSINELQKQLKERDTDLKNLQAQLSDGTKSNETKISELTGQLTKLQDDYKNAKKDYEDKLSAQAYNFAVREYAGGRKFTSEAAKRDFINEMLSAKLSMKDNSIIGATDFETTYRSNNEDAFVVENSNNNSEELNKKPLFVQPSNQVGPKNNEEDPFLKAFGFVKE